MRNLILILWLLSPLLLASQNATKKLRKIIEKDNIKALNAFLGEDGDINACYEINESTYSLMILSIKYDAVAMFQAGIKGGADLDQIGDQKTPLMYAIKHERMAIFKTLIAQGADPNIESSSGKTASDYAVKYHRVGLTE
ncbi:MAG: ankyrin repeat domain-containing protein [Bacteroidia bacterium]